MKNLGRRALAGVILGMTASVAIAGGPAVTIGSATVPVGTMNVPIALNFDTMGATVTGFGFNVVYDTANLTFTGCTPAMAITTCAELVMPGTINIGNLGAPPANPFVTLNFDASSAAVGAYPLMAAAMPAPSYTDGAFMDQSLTVNPGTLTVQAGPGPGVMDVTPAMVNLVNTVNGPASTQNLTIRNQGAMGDNTLTANCSLGGVTADPGVTLTVAPATGVMLAPGASTTRQASCSGTASGNASGTYTCNGGPAGMDSSAVSCAVGAGVAVPAPPAGSMLTLPVGPVVRGQTGTGTQSFSETNNAGAGYDVTCNITNDGGGAFVLFGSGMQSVPPGGTAGVTVQGTSSVFDPQPTGTMVCTYTNGATGTVTVTLIISLIPEIVPTLSQWGLILMILALVGVGAYRMRRRTNVA